MIDTNAFREMLQGLLKSLCNQVFYEAAGEGITGDDGSREEFYPHIVFSFKPIDLGDLSRKDYIVEVHIWDKGTSARRVEELSDRVENIFRRERNMPQKEFLPTFFLIDRNPAPDEDREIRHRVIRIQSQVYER